MDDKVKLVKSLRIDPNGEHILVKVDPPESLQRSAGGIIVPTGVLQNKKTQTGTVVAIGEGRRDPSNYSERVPLDVEVGSHVLFAQFIGYPVLIPSEDGTQEEHVLIKHHDILGFVHEESVMVSSSEFKDYFRNRS